MNKKYIPKEISWLSFNERVLQEAENKEVPLLERFKLKDFQFIVPGQRKYWDTILKPLLK